MTNNLIKGFEEFRRDNYSGKNALMPRLNKEGQAPEYFIISCIDSRSNPGTIFKPEPGTFFAHKAMGAIVRPYKKGTALAAALQFALIHSGVKKIIVLGHTNCGAVKALVENIKDEEISSFITVAQEGLESAKKCCGEDTSHPNLLRQTEEQILLQSIKNLKTYPSVQKMLTDKNLLIKPWLFDMKSGALLEYDEEIKEFSPLSQTDTQKEDHA